MPQSIAKYLGPPRFTRGIAEEQDEIGVATGVAYTPSGGDILSIEVALMRGKGNLMLTGQLGEVMKESAQAALSYSRARSEEWHLKDGYFSTKDIHIHIPAGAMPKEGPSAGAALTTALVSALTRKPVRKDVAMTGEITLRGKVLPVGGIKEKVLALTEPVFFLSSSLRRTAGISTISQGTYARTSILFRERDGRGAGSCSANILIPAKDVKRGPPASDR